VLARAGRNPLTSSPVPLAIIDSGFTNGYPDWPAVIAQKTSGPNPTPCGGSPCPWHGNAVTETALALTDDRFGTAGVAGRVAAPARSERPRGRRPASPPSAPAASGPPTASISGLRAR